VVLSSLEHFEYWSSYRSSRGPVGPSDGQRGEYDVSMHTGSQQVRVVVVVVVVVAVVRPGERFSYTRCNGYLRVFWWWWWRQ
jgi:hypothetical protein